MYKEKRYGKDVQSPISQMTPKEKASLCSGTSFWYTKPVE